MDLVMAQDRNQFSLMTISSSTTTWGMLHPPNLDCKFFKWGGPSVLRGWCYFLCFHALKNRIILESRIAHIIQGLHFVGSFFSFCICNSAQCGKWKNLLSQFLSKKFREINWFRLNSTYVPFSRNIFQVRGKFWFFHTV